ncbi:MAG: holo-ACP synthase [Saprospiraceae bacterium]
MIAGIGTDIVEVSRIREKLEKHSGFVDKVFSVDEQEYCRKQKFPEQHFAARFAAKEAFLKACGTGLLLSYELSDIEIKQTEKGQPFIECKGKFEEFLRENKWHTIRLSISHIEAYALAFVTIEQ